MDELIDQIADLIDEAGDYDNWTPQTRRAWQDEVLRRVGNELEAREPE
jgi:hypothetical protein